MIYSNPQYEFKNIETQKNALSFQIKVFVQYTSSENKSLEEKSVEFASTTIYVSLWYIYGHSLKCVAAYLNAYAVKVIKTSKMSNKEKISTYFTYFKDNQRSQTTSDICIYTVVLHAALRLPKPLYWYIWPWDYNSLTPMYEIKDRLNAVVNGV